MLRMGVFEGKYLNDCVGEFPVDWFLSSRGDLLSTLSPEAPNIDLNHFEVKSRMSLNEWENKGWIPVQRSQAARTILRMHDVLHNEIDDPDPRGWFQWYCRYYLGRRVPIIDDIQKKRWYAFKRHKAQLMRHCKGRSWGCRLKQKQALLQWAYNPYLCM
jgi:hypothetical protein